MRLERGWQVQASGRSDHCRVTRWLALEDFRIGCFEATAARQYMPVSIRYELAFKKVTPSGSKNLVPAARAAGLLKSPAACT